MVKAVIINRRLIPIVDEPKTRRILVVYAIYSSVIVDPETSARYLAERGRKWSEFIAAPEVVFVRSAKTEVRRRKRPHKVASERPLCSNNSLIVHCLQCDMPKRPS